MTSLDSKVEAGGTSENYLRLAIGTAGETTRALDEEIMIETAKSGEGPKAQMEYRLTDAAISHTVDTFSADASRGGHTVAGSSCGGGTPENLA